MTTIIRLATPAEIQAAGYGPMRKDLRAVIRVALGWTVGGEGMRCRYVGAGRVRCSSDAVAILRRPHGAGGSQRWAYCAQHLYGTYWIECDRVVRLGLAKEVEVREVLGSQAPQTPDVLPVIGAWEDIQWLTRGQQVTSVALLYRRGDLSPVVGFGVWDAQASRWTWCLMPAGPEDHPQISFPSASPEDTWEPTRAADIG